MIKKGQIVEIIYKAIEDLNEENHQHQLEKSDDTILLGKGSQIDSLEFVNLISSIEDYIEEELDVVVTIVNEHSIAIEPSPFRTIDTLTKYILSCL